MRVGIGYDVHRLVEGRRLVIGGVVVPYHLGLEGHSDADVLVHAVMDALLGAASAGDIGKHFPDTDMSYRDISSLILLEQVAKYLANNGWEISNVDAVVIAQAPKLGPYMLQMSENLARVLQLVPDQVNVKATTTEKLGFAGRGEGIAAQAVACINRINPCTY